MSNNDVIGLCSDCGTEQSDRSMFASPFAQAGKPPVCRYCAGVVVVCYRRDKQKVLDDIKRQRGLQ
jgi:hypothetical protein